MVPTPCILHNRVRKIYVHWRILGNNECVGKWKWFKKWQSALSKFAFKSYPMYYFNNGIVTIFTISFTILFRISNNTNNILSNKYLTRKPYQVTEIDIYTGLFNKNKKSLSNSQIREYWEILASWSSRTDQ